MNEPHHAIQDPEPEDFGGPQVPPPAPNDNNLDRYFKGQQKDEIFICFFRQHWIYLLKELLYLGVFFFIALMTIFYVDSIKAVLQGNTELKLLFLTGFLAMTGFFHRIFVKIFNFFARVCIITNMRIIDHQKTIFFTDNTDSIDMSQIQFIEKIEQGIVPHILKYGDIKIFLSASSMIKTLRGVPNAKFHFRCINREKEARHARMFHESPREPGKISLANTSIPVLPNPVTINQK